MPDPDRSAPTDGATARDVPDLPVLPPFYPLGALALAVLLEWLAPLGYLPPPLSLATAIVGLALVAAGLASAVSGALAFRRGGTSIDPREPSLVLVETGPYRLTRNPMYLGFLLAFAGIGLLASLDWFALLLVPLWLGLHHGVVLREEAFLRARFGDPYDDFRARTRRWL